MGVVEVAKKLNVIMTKLYEKVTDVEFLIMGIGDLACDSCPFFQISIIGNITAQIRI